MKIPYLFKARFKANKKYKKSLYKKKIIVIVCKSKKVKYEILILKKSLYKKKPL
jgi:hypothetical protein